MNEEGRDYYDHRDYDEDDLTPEQREADRADILSLMEAGAERFPSLAPYRPHKGD